jgi:hypothetical protein
MSGLGLDNVLQDSDLSMTVTPSVPTPLDTGSEISPNIEDEEEDEDSDISEAGPSFGDSSSDIGVESDSELEDEETQPSDNFNVTQSIDSTHSDVGELSEIVSQHESENDESVGSQPAALQSDNVPRFDMKINEPNNSQSEGNKNDHVVEPKKETSLFANNGAKMDEKMKSEPNMIFTTRTKIREETTDLCEPKKTGNLSKVADKLSTSPSYLRPRELETSPADSSDESSSRVKAPLLIFGSGTSTPIPKSLTAVKLPVSDVEQYSSKDEIESKRDSRIPAVDSAPDTDSDSAKFSSDWNIADSGMKSDVEDYPGIDPYIPLSKVDNEDGKLADFDLFYKQVSVLFENVESNLFSLQTAIRWNKRSNPGKQIEDCENFEKWTLDDATEAPFVRHTLDHLGSRAAAIGHDERVGEKQIPELKRLLNSVSLQLSRIQEIIRYKEGEASERALILRSLPVNAIELQRKLRSSSLNLEEKLSLVEHDINLLKGKLSSMSMARPTAHTIKNSIYQISLYAQQRYDKVDELNKMMKEKLNLDGDIKGPRTPLKGVGYSTQSPRSASREAARNDVDFLVRKSKRDNNRQLGNFLYGRSERDIFKTTPLKQPSFE